MLRRVLVVVALFAALAVPVASRDATAAGNCSWPMFGREPGRSFATTGGCTTISRTTAPTLRPKWFVRTSDEVSASPTIVDGHVFVGDWSGRFYSLNAATGATEWTFDVDDTSPIGFGRIVSSAAYTEIGGMKIVVFGGGATLYALDATTGAPINSVCVDSRAVPDDQRCRAGGSEVEIESSPAIVPEGDGSTSVVVGMDVHNDRGKGRAGVIKFALTASGLTTLWKFDPDARRTVGLTDDPQGGSGCADVWGSPAVDVKGDRVFFGTGSCDSGPDALTTGEHVWAVALGDGSYVWDYRAHDADTGTVDDDFGGALNLLPGNLVGAGNKDGAYYELARDDGHLVHKVQVGQPGHVSDGFAVGGILASAAVGEVNGKPAVFTATAISTPNDKPLQDGPDTAPPSVLQDPQRMFSLAAIDVESGAILWRSPVARQAYGPPTYANGVVLVPCTFDFQIDAFDANTGLPLAARPMTGPPSSGPTAIGDSVYGGVGTSTGEGSPLALLGGVYGMQVSGL